MTTLPERLRIKASMISLGEKIAWGSDTEVMNEAADEIERLTTLAQGYLAELVSTRTQRDAYQQASDTMAASHNMAISDAMAECDKVSFSASEDAEHGHKTCRAGGAVACRNRIKELLQ